MNDRSIYIIGAGISGLVAAIELEKAGYYPVILEATDRAGGRVKTDEQDGYLLDQGFQVLLTAYPELSRYLNLEKLHLKKFRPGAVIFKPGATYSVHDPLRNPFKIFAMAFSKVGTVWDKYKMYALIRDLKEKPLDAIFSLPQTSTHEYLKQYGFSDKIIQNFFKPFFSGIFLETSLSTSSRMFEFVFKMFAEGEAAVPEKGMSQISQQLVEQLEHTQIRFDIPVLAVEKNKIILADENTITADEIIIATDPGKLTGQKEIAYHQVTNIYYTLQQSFIGRPMLGLVPDDKFLVNNLVFMTDVSPAYASNERALLSVSVVKETAGIEKLEQMIALELEAITGINASYFEHLKTYTISQALPILKDAKHWVPMQHVKMYDHVYLAGDHLLNGSINAAMTSGRLAAEAVISAE
ncbi:Flavin containing amine oxidoreductase [Cyclobacterium lianum]|uniref:Flavin containing amine oxidoreductase n=1 Tax=Cyclobacterium lianum TaxID=388280 RepID=A0A1M7L0V8_9BACT|nr:NAD(P)/FAD-dependent oxidoreductase [Cyclobacterium lianum]SHM70956.1 Flavin containing amine oxidoreductase [Cyclobacterium lianum]